MTSRRPAALLALAALALPAAALADDPLFRAPWRAWDAGDMPKIGPTAVAFGDLDGDGDRDAVLSRDLSTGFFDGAGLSVVRSNGDGTFAPKEVYAVPVYYNLTDVALADVDSDGDLDALATVYGHPLHPNFRLLLQRNPGDGTLAAPQYFPTGDGPHALVVGDFTGDGHPDVVTADERGDTISLLEHDGQSGAAAAFLPPVPTAVGGWSAFRIGAADLDGDGDLDLAVGRGHFGPVGEHGIDVFLNDGAGGFGFAATYENVEPAYRHSPAVHLADLDADGDPDLVTGGGNTGVFGQGIVSFRLNDGAGGFGPETLRNLGHATFTPHSIATCDFDGDGWLDVLATTPSGRAVDGVNVLLSTGAGEFEPVAFSTAAKQTFDVVCEDVDRDGDPDVVTVAHDSAVLTVHDNPGDGTLFALATLATFGGVVDSLAVGDLDGDGDPDVVVTDTAIRVLLGDGEGGFSPVDSYPAGTDVADLELRDLDGDGDLDLVLGDDPGDPPYDFVTALNRGNGTFDPPVVTPVGACQGGAVEAVDLDGDGVLDVALAEPGSCAGGVDGRIFVYRGLGDGTFVFAHVFDPPGLPFGVLGADFDEDGDADLLTDGFGGLLVLPGNGDFTFGPALATGVSAEGARFAIGDLDADGRPDVALIGDGDANGTTVVGTLRGLGDGTFAVHEVPGGSGLESPFRVSVDVDVADVDGDGVLDVVVSNNAPNDVSVFLGNGDGTLRPHDGHRYGLGYGASQSGVGDFTGDGRADLVGIVGLPPLGLPSALMMLESAAPAGIFADGFESGAAGTWSSFTG